VVRNTQNYWVTGHSGSFGTLNTKKHNVSEIDPISETLCILVFRIPYD
jgi:hypothetical protein